MSRKLSRIAHCLCTGLFLSAVSVPVMAQPDYSKIEVSTSEVLPGIYLLAAEGGGNMILATGEDGALLIDDHLAPLTAKVQKAIATVTDQPVRFLVNTHWHFDHAGGNEVFGSGGAIIVAHDNVRARMAKGQVIAAFNMEVPPAAKSALPVMTFDSGLTFHWNDDTLEVVHPAPAHTDGDAIVYFTSANVVHVGDLYWNGTYPFIDGSSGGSTAGVIAGVAAVLARIDDDTKVIPGHGLPSGKAKLQSYHDMLKTVHDRIAVLKEQGKSLEEIIAAKPTAEYDAAWGKGMLGPDAWVGIVYSAL